MYSILAKWWGDKLIVRAFCGMSREKAGISMLNASPVAVTIP
jgi:hypothetical protein